MSIRNLDALFRPETVAVVGASGDAGSVGNLVMTNLLRSGFEGPILPVNPNRRSVAGVWTYPNVASLPEVPDLAVICTPAPTVPEIVAQLGERGTRAAAVLTAGLSRSLEEGRPPLVTEMLEASRPHLLRLLGPNCLGLLVPGMGLNASFAHRNAEAGGIAFVSQSGALCTAVLDWAADHKIGFSHFVSMGNMADVDFGDVIDYLAGEVSCQAILLYIESITDARKFLSAARAASSNKPVVAIKAGRRPEGAQAAASHTGALTGSDLVFEGALRRAGVLRVKTVEGLFDAVETLARVGKARGERLAILTNGGGPGVLAVDVLTEGGGVLAELSDETISALDEFLPDNWSRSNPVDIIGDASGERYRRALAVLMRDPGVDAVLVMYAPVAVVPGLEAARAVVEVVAAQKRRRAPNVLTCWLGGSSGESARRLLAEAGIATYDSPESAVEAYLRTVQHARNQEALRQTPPSVAREFPVRRDEARRILGTALAEGRGLLTEPEAKALLAAYDIPCVETVIATTPEEAAAKGAEIGFPVALKILSHDISHKSDVGGVVLDLEDGEAVRTAAVAMQRRVGELMPEASIQGFTVQPMARRPEAYELIVGMSVDPIFGPVLMFGEGGTAVEVVADRAVALPPINLLLARRLIERTRISRLLRGFRDQPPVDLEALGLTLVKISHLVVDLPEVVELDVNPLFSDSHGVLTLDARVRIVEVEEGAPPRLAIRPYPRELEEEVRLPGGERVLFRPIRPEDEPAHRAFLDRLQPEDVYFRFFGMVREMPHSQLTRLTQIDYDREMAFIATNEPQAGVEEAETLGVVRVVFDPNGQVGEFAVVVRSDLKGKGMGRALMDKMIRYCRARGVRTIVGQVLHENRAMLALAKKLGFERASHLDKVVEVRLELDRP